LSAILDTPDTELGIGSVGLLDGGQTAWVQIESPENVVHSSGEVFRPWLAGYSSLDGTLRTGFKEGVTRAVCDNTFDAFMSEHGKGYSYKNTANSKLVVASARDALDLLEKITDEFTRELDGLLSTPVTDRQWSEILEFNYATVGKEGRSLTMAVKRQEAIDELYRMDTRVSPFMGTAWGAFQAFSTFNQHESTVRKGDNEYQRNMRKNLSGQTFGSDAAVMDSIDKVLVRA
jgi:phage/plasmid-like protein (TIGR03299 family)